FGQSVLDENGLPALDTPAGISAAEYAQELMAYSPPDILTMAWDQRILRFSQGNCAMTYGWGARTYLAEDEITSVVSGLVGYTGAPTSADTDAVTPMGVWSLGIPANIGDRDAIAWGFLEWFTSSETQQLLAEFGNGGMPRYSVIQNPDLSARYPAFSTVEQLSEAGELDDWMRPAVPQWSSLADVMGTVFHDMLRGNLTPAEATAQAQADALLLFE
ncbi:MAG: extracellular solute-binding protein, partial [Chloroflexota bacterium]